MLWLHSLKVAQLLRSAACLHTNQSRSYLNHLVLNPPSLHCLPHVVVSVAIRLNGIEFVWLKFQSFGARRTYEDWME